MKIIWFITLVGIKSGENLETVPIDSEGMEYFGSFDHKYQA